MKKIGSVFITAARVQISHEVDQDEVQSLSATVLTMDTCDGFSWPPLINHRHHGSTLLLRSVNSCARSSPSSPLSPFSIQTSVTGKPPTWTAQLGLPRKRFSSPSDRYGGGTMASTFGAGIGRVARISCHHQHHHTAATRGIVSTTTTHGSGLLYPGCRQLVQNPAASGRIRLFSSSTGAGGNGGKRPRFSQRLGEALKNSKVTWYQIPVAVGIGFLGLVQFYKVSSREKQKEQRAQEEEGDRPQKRPRVRPGGPWYVDDAPNSS